MHDLCTITDAVQVTEILTPKSESDEGKVKETRQLSIVKAQGKGHEERF